MFSISSGFRVEGLVGESFPVKVLDSTNCPGTSYERAYGTEAVDTIGTMFFLVSKIAVWLKSDDYLIQEVHATLLVGSILYRSSSFLCLYMKEMNPKSRI